MATQLLYLPDGIKGEWCDLELAKKASATAATNSVEDVDYVFLRGQWAKDLLSGDLKAAHKSWGRWQGFSGVDPWEDLGWRNFLELQKFGESLWEDFDASRIGELVLLRTFISCLTGADSD
jgi:hypothetical protein